METESRKPKFNLKETLDRWNAHIWRVRPREERRGFGARLCAAGRVAILTIRGVNANKIPSQAAALAYASLIALGPMVALAIMISGFVLKDKAEDFATQKLHQTIEFIAPQLAAYDSEEVQALETDSPDGDGAAQAKQINPQVVSMVENLVKKAGSGTGGAIGSLLLAVICIRLIVSIENTFNLIWGVRRGRGWFQRILGYWAVLTLGSILGFTAAGLLTTSAIMRHLEGLTQAIPGLAFLATYAAPAIALLTLVLLLTLFYRYMPNTNVRWVPALTGGAVVTLLVVLNYALSFFYVSYVVRQQSLYGGIGIVFVLMFGLYIFWLFMLLGGQITYAVQNMEHVAHERAWQNASPHVRKLLALAVFVKCARRFEDCAKPATAAELSEALGAPLHLVNEALSQMTECAVLSAAALPEDSGNPVIAYQPARPLEKFRVIDLQFELDNEGNSEGLELLSDADPALPRYLAAIRALRATPELGATMRDLISHCPVRAA